MLTLQAGRFLISAYKKAQRGKKVSLSVAYLNNLADLQSKTCSASSVDDLESIQEAFDVTCTHFIKIAFEAFHKLKQQGETTENAHLKSSLQKSTAAKLHAMNTMFSVFRNTIASADVSIQSKLISLCQVFGLSLISEEAGNFLMASYYQSLHIEAVNEKV